MRMFACYLDNDGQNLELHGDTLEDIREALESVGYDGTKVVVTKVNDEIIGWCDAENYRYA